MFSYKKPSLHEIVFVTLKNVESNDIGNYVDLIDYDEIEGLILCTEITKYNANIKKLVKHGEIFPVVVISDDKGYDLSYSKIKEDWRDLLKESHEYCNKLYKLINKLNQKLNLTEDVLHNLIKLNISPKLYDDSINSKKNLYKEIYEAVLKNPNELFTEYPLIDETIKSNICEYITNNLIIKPYVVQKEFKLLIFESNSLIKLKEILNKIKNIINNMDYPLIGYELSIDNSKREKDKKDKGVLNGSGVKTPINHLTDIVECKSSPVYYYKLTNVNLDTIEKVMNDINEKIQEIINNSEYNCNFNFIDNYNIIKKGEILFNF